MACAGCGESVAAGARFCSVCGRAVTLVAAPPPPVQIQDFGGFRLDGLYRPREGRMIAGVCAGFATRYGWEVSIVRLVLVLSLVFGAGIPFVAYVIAWVVMPNGQWRLPVHVEHGGPGSMRV